LSFLRRPNDKSIFYETTLCTHNMWRRMWEFSVYFFLTFQNVSNIHSNKRIICTWEPKHHSQNQLGFSHLLDLAGRISCIIFSMLALTRAPAAPTIRRHTASDANWWGVSPAMPMFRAFDSWREHGRLANSTTLDRNRTYTRVYPGSPPPEGKDIHPAYLILYCLNILGAAIMVRRWDLAEVEEDGVASLCTWDLCEIRCLCEIRYRSFLAALPRPYMGGEVLGSGPSQVQVYANPN
jgi:hypothetical protein